MLKYRGSVQGFLLGPTAELNLTGWRERWPAGIQTQTPLPWRERVTDSATLAEPNLQKQQRFSHRVEV